MVEQLKSPFRQILGFRISGKLHDADYDQLIPVIKAAIKEQGTIRLLVVMEDFHGWDLHAIWDDTKCAAMHFADFDYIALVGDKPWEHWLAGLCKISSMAKVKYFHKTELDEAWHWVAEGLIPPPEMENEERLAAPL